jgi:DNA-binding NarL/FixJ family response regulator
MDLNMPRMNGLDATRALAVGSPGTAALVLAMFDNDESLFTAMRAGARGYLLKGVQAVYYGTQLRPASNAKAKSALGLTLE